MHLKDIFETPEEASVHGNNCCCMHSATVRKDSIALLFIKLHLIENGFYACFVFQGSHVQHSVLATQLPAPGTVMHKAPMLSFLGMTFVSDYY